jgi:hypothetical protein
MLLRDFYMQENHHGYFFCDGSDVAPNPKLKVGRTKRVDFDVFEWTKYIDEGNLLEAIPTVYGCDPRDADAYNASQKTMTANYEKQQNLASEKEESDPADTQEH